MMEFVGQQKLSKTTHTTLITTIIDCKDTSYKYHGLKGESNLGTEAASRYANDGSNRNKQNRLFTETSRYTQEPAQKNVKQTSLHRVIGAAW